MSKPWILITPSSRGIGHALTRHLLRATPSSTVPILATYRDDLPAVRASLLRDSSLPPAAAAARLHLTHLDVTSERSVAAAAAEADRLFPRATHHLRLALAVPGILPLPPEKAPEGVDVARALETFRVNALGPLLLMKWFGKFLPRRGTELAADDGDELLPRGRAVWASMSARVGSVSDNRTGGWYSYRGSKAAVNSMTKSFDLHLAVRSGDKAMALAYHPGTVRTDLSRDFWRSVPEGKLFAPEYAAEKMLEVVTRKVGLEGRGRIWDHNGVEIAP